MDIDAPAQAGIEAFKGFFQDEIRTMVRNDLLDAIARQVTDLHGGSHRLAAGFQRRRGPARILNLIPFG